MKSPFLLVVFCWLNLCVLRGQHYEIVATPYDGCGTYSDCRLGSATPSPCEYTQHEYFANFIKITNATIVGNRLTIDFKRCDGQSFSSSEGVAIRTSACLCTAANISPSGQNTDIGNNTHQIYGDFLPDFTSGTRTYYVQLKISTEHYQTAGVTVRASNLAAPTILAQTGASIGAIDVGWNRVANATKYVLYKKTGNNIWLKLKTYPAITADTIVTVNGYVAGAETCFRMKASNDAGDWSQPSNESCTKAGVLTVSPGTVKVSHLADSMRIDVTSGYTWTATRPASATWLTLTKEAIANTQNGKIKLVFAANELIPANHRTCDVTISATVNGVVVRRVVKVLQDSLKIDPPVISPPNGTVFFNDTTVSIRAEPNTSIFYTTDSSEPTVNSRRYMGSFRIDTSTLIKAIAVKFAPHTPNMARDFRNIANAPSNHTNAQGSNTAAASNDKKTNKPTLLKPAAFQAFFYVPTSTNKIKFEWKDAIPTGKLKIRHYSVGADGNVVDKGYVREDTEATNLSTSQEIDLTFNNRVVAPGDYFLWNVNNGIESETRRFDVGAVLSPVYGYVTESASGATTSNWAFNQRGHTTGIKTKDKRAWDANLTESMGGNYYDREYDEGMPVYSVADNGKSVTWATSDKEIIGQILIKYDDPFKPWFAGILHMNPISIINNSVNVNTQSRLGLVSSTGCGIDNTHLHFAVYRLRADVPEEYRDRDDTEDYLTVNRKIIPRFAAYKQDIKSLENASITAETTMPPSATLVSPGSNAKEIKTITELKSLSELKFNWQGNYNLPRTWMDDFIATPRTSLIPKYFLYIAALSFDETRNEVTSLKDYKKKSCVYKRVNLLYDGFEPISIDNQEDLPSNECAVDGTKFKEGFYSWRIRTKYFNNIESLSEKFYFKVTANTIKVNSSILSNANIRVKLNSKWLDYGKTDASGTKSMVFLPQITPQDSVQIKAVGCETLRFTPDSTFVLGEVMNVPMIRRSDYNQRLELIQPKINYVVPSIISRTNTMAFKITARNLVKVEYSKDDSTWQQLPLLNALGDIPLDTGFNAIRFRLTSSIDTFQESKQVYYYPTSLVDTNAAGERIVFTDTLRLDIQESAKNCHFYMDDEYMGELRAGIHQIEVPRQGHRYSFSKTGYITQKESEKILDTLYVSLEEIAFRSDSAEYDCLTERNVYRNGITVQSSGGKYRIIKSYLDYSSKGLIPRSYTTTIRRLTATTDTLKLHSILNQPSYPSSDSTYLLEIRDGNYRKHYPSRFGDSIVYDSTIQKLGHYKLTGQTEGLVLMQRLAPLRSTGYPRVSVHQSEGVKFAWKDLFRDPDSLLGDMSYEALSDSNFVIEGQGDSLYLRHRSCNTGRLTFRCRAKHDELSRVEGFEIEVQPLRVSATPLAARCFGTATGRITTQLSSATPLYEYQWSNGLRLPNAANLRAGAYTVVVRDTNRCADSAQVTVTQPPLLTLQTVVTPIACHESNGNSASGGISVRSTGGINANHRYEWSNNAGNVAELRGLSAGIYTVTVRDDNQCTQIHHDTLRQPAALQNRFDNRVAETCDGQNGQTTAIVNGGEFPYSYRWQNNETGERAFRLARGNNSVTVTDAHGCTKVDTVAIAFDTTLRVDVLLGSRLKCFGDRNGWGTIQISGARNVSYSWNTGAITDSVTQVPAGTYTVTVSSPLCRLTRSLTVTQPPLLQVDSFRLSSVPCTPKSGQITAFAGGGTAPYTYLWSNAFRTPQISNLLTGNYQVTVTDANRCQSVGSTPLQVMPDLTARVTIQNVRCYGESNAQIIVNADGGNGRPYQYRLDGGSFQQNAVLDQLKAGAYTLTIRDGLNCDTTQTVLITQPVQVQVALGADETVRLGDSVLLKPIQTSPATVVFDWKPIVGLRCPSCAETWARPFVPTTYILTVKDPSSRCEQQDSIKIGVNNPKNLPVVNPYSGRSEFLSQRAAGHIRKIVSMEIVTVLGQVLYQVKDVAPNAPDMDWIEVSTNAGTLPTLFFYRITVEYWDNSTGQFAGSALSIR